MTTFLFVRHSTPTGGPGDAGLSAAGRELASRAAARLDVPHDVRLLSSPLRRARETAQIFADHLGRDITIDTRLRERANWGDTPGESWDDFVARWEQCDVERDLIPPRGRSSRQTGDDMAAFVRDVARAGEETVLAVSHGGAILDFLLNIYTVDELAARKPDYREMSHCALTEVDLRDDGYDLRRFADPCLIAE